MITFSQTSIAAVKKKATGALGFIPINLNLTFEFEHSDGEMEALRIPFGVDFFYPSE
jgi:hypothetical protein